MISMSSTHNDQDEAATTTAEASQPPADHNTTPPSAPITPQIDEDSVIILAALAAEGQHSVWKNKLVLLFETQYTQRQAQDWITEFNKDAVVPLMYLDELRNSMHLVKILTKTDSTDQELIISQSSLLARNVFATVNRYNRSFHQLGAPEATHLVTVNI
jgi:hypothetical protein